MIRWLFSMYGFIEVKKFRCRKLMCYYFTLIFRGFQILNQEPIQHSFVYSSLLLVISWLFESGCGSAAPAIDGNSFRPAEQIQVRSTESGSLIKGTQHETSRWASFEQKLYIRSMLFWHDSDNAKVPSSGSPWMSSTRIVWNIHLLGTQELGLWPRKKRTNNWSMKSWVMLDRSLRGNDTRRSKQGPWA